MNSHVNRQVARILDEAQADRVSVIIQMKSKGELGEYIQAATEAMIGRKPLVSARALVPPRSDMLRLNANGRITPKSKELLEGSNLRSADTFLSGQALAAARWGDITSHSRKALHPLLDWSHGRSVRTFLSSGSAVMTLAKDELCQLSREVGGITEIFPNRTVRVPPVYKSDDLPPVVKDNKGFTWGVSRTGAMACWGGFGARGKDVLVAVLDTGVDPAHPDLKGKVAGFAEFGETGEIKVDDPAAAYDSDQHGTHCAGIIAGGCASGRWIGMAPEAKILAGLVLKNGAGRDSQILAGIDWAIKKRAHVISMSLGGLRMSADVLDTYTQAIISANRLGIPVIVAAGNDGSQTTGAPGNDYFAFTVGATDVEDRAAGFSGGRTQIIEKSRYISREHLPVVYSKPDVTAPGVDVYSAVPGGKWESWNGTSMAAPHVAGALALLLSRPTTIRQIKGVQRTNILQTLMISTVKELGEAGQDHRFGFGRIDILRAVGYAKDLGYWKE